MNVDFTQAKATLAKHYAFLAADPGWADYVRDRLDQMARENPEFFGDMPELVKKAADDPGARA